MKENLPPFNFIDEATNHVEKYLDDRFSDSLARITREINGEGCGCNQCSRLAVDEINKYVDLITHANAPDLHFRLSFDNGFAEIIPPEEPQ